MGGEGVLHKKPQTLLCAPNLRPNLNLETNRGRRTETHVGVRNRFLKLSDADRQRNEESKGKGRSSSVTVAEFRRVLELYPSYSNYRRANQTGMGEATYFKRVSLLEKMEAEAEGDIDSLKLTDKGLEDLRKTEKKKKKKKKSAQRE